MNTRARFHTLTAVAAMTLIGLTGCTAQAGDASSGMDVSMTGEAYPEIAVFEDDMVAMAGQDASITEQTASMIQEAWLSIEVQTIEDAVDTAQQLVQERGGRIDHRSLSRGGDEQSASHASLTLRVPEDRLDETMTELGSLGRVLHESVNATDVTLQRTDLTARLTSLERSIEQLTSLLDETSTVSEIIEIETALSQRQSDLDSLSAQLDVLEDRIHDATIGLELTKQQPNVPEVTTGFWGAIQTGFWALVSLFQAAFLGLGYALPWVIFAALIVGIFWIIIRARRGRKLP